MTQRDPFVHKTKYIYSKYSIAQSSEMDNVMYAFREKKLCVRSSKSLRKKNKREKAYKNNAPLDDSAICIYSTQYYSSSTSSSSSPLGASKREEEMMGGRIIIIDKTVK